MDLTALFAYILFTTAAPATAVGSTNSVLVVVTCNGWVPPQGGKRWGRGLLSLTRGTYYSVCLVGGWAGRWGMGFGFDYVDYQLACLSVLAEWPLENDPPPLSPHPMH